jgi:dihydrofolate synthase/folylpolyglutamate synthase
VSAPAAKPLPALDDILARLSALHPKRIDLTLDRMLRILERLDHPERKLPPVIHVAGTNGKGSTVAYLRAILEAAGLRVHVYTSPHLVRINERFRLGQVFGQVGGGVLATDDQLRTALAHCEEVNGGEPITIFEMETAAALTLFAQHPADAVLLEVGLGGRLDATNVIEAPAVSVITPIGIDHQDFLGDTLLKIAAEKAGIIKKRVPVVCAEQGPEAAAVIESHASRARAPLHAAGQEWHVNVERGRLVYQRRVCSAATSSTMPGWRLRPCARPMSSRSTRPRSKSALRGRNGRRACNGSPPARWWPRRRSIARSGWTAATTSTAAAWWPRRWAIWRSGCRARWWSSPA